MASRVKGQETIFRFIKDNKLVAEVSDIQEFDFEFDRTLLEEGYVGEKQNRYDDIYNGVKGNTSFHISDHNLIAFFSELNDRSRRKVASFRVDAITVVEFDDGESTKILLTDLFFGSIPFRNSGRGAYIASSLTFACSDYKILS